MRRPTAMGRSHPRLSRCPFHASRPTPPAATSPSAGRRRRGGWWRIQTGRGPEIGPPFIGDGGESVVVGCRRITRSAWRTSPSHLPAWRGPTRRRSPGRGPPWRSKLARPAFRHAPAFIRLSLQSPFPLRGVFTAVGRATLERIVAVIVVRVAIVIVRVTSGVIVARGADKFTRVFFVVAGLDAHRSTDELTRTFENVL